MQIIYIKQWQIQDFPLEGALTRWRGANLRRIHFSVKMYAKMKEMDPVGGGGGASGAPGSANVKGTTWTCAVLIKYQINCA